MIIINKDARPKDTIYHIASCSLGVLKERGPIDLKKLFEITKDKYELANLSYTSFQLGINFLFLINKVELDREKIKCI